MGKYDVELKCSDVRKLIKERKYDKAYEVLQTIDITHVKNLMDYKAFFEVYSNLKRYDDAKEMLIRMYQRTSSKRILYQLVCLAIRSQNLSEAESSYQDFIKSSSESEDRYILRYMIDKAKHADYKVRIESLEKLKQYNYYEDWAYELAKLYHKSGDKEACIKECKNIILWFGEGIIVEKAKMLKNYYENGNTSFLKKTNPFKKEKVPVQETVKDKPDVERLTETSVAENAESKQVLVSDTVDLAKQISYIKELEKEEKVKDEFAKDISLTVNMKDTIQKVKEQQSILANQEAAVTLEKPKLDLSKLNITEEEIEKLEQSISSKEEGEAEADAFDEPVQVLELDELMPVMVKDINLSKILKDYLDDERLRNQIIDNLTKLVESKQNPYLYVTTDDASSGLKFLKHMAKAFEKLGVIKKSQVAKIKGGNLNHIKLANRAEQLKNSVLLVEGASELYLPTIQELMMLMDNLKGELVIVFEDTEENMKIFEEEHYELKEQNSYIINL